MILKRPRAGCAHSQRSVRLFCWTKHPEAWVISTLHLISPGRSRSRAAWREQRIVRWLDSIAPHADRVSGRRPSGLSVEYRDVVPRGLCGLLGTLARMKDSGIDVQAFTGKLRHVDVRIL